MYNTAMTRAYVHYTVSFFLLTIYGGQVCPFVDGLALTKWAVIMAVVMTAAFTARSFIITRFVEEAEPYQKASRQFALEISVFFAAALAVTLYDAAYYDFPLGSGIKVMTGFLTFGFFAAVDLALEKERQVSGEFAESRRTMLVDPARVFPMTTRFAIVASVTVALAVTVLFLIINKDMEWLGQFEANERYPRLIVLGEMGLVGAVFLAHIVNVILSYRANLRLFFGWQNGALEAVAGGALDAIVPVSTRDEFGVMGDYTNRMIEALRDRTEEVQRTQDVTILSLASLAETRDNETGAHILRTQRYVRALALELRGHPRFYKALDPDSIDLLYKSAPLHDIGKVGVPDAILLKPGKLTAEEFETMKKHTVYGRDALIKAEAALDGGADDSFLKHAREISYSHHEKWDGSGYPEGLKGEGIPVSARLMALADVYDALISKRVYKEAFTHEKARDIIMQGGGSHFDPAVVEAFAAIEDKFVEIAAELKDSK